MKEKSESDILRDLYVKLKPVFSSDVYIYKNKYVISGRFSKMKVLGYYLCELNEKYSDIVKNYFQDKSIIYIQDLVKIKDEMNSFFTIIREDSSEYRRVQQAVNHLIKERDGITTWKNMVENYDGIIDRFYKMNNTYTINIPERGDCIEIGKSLFPTITAKSIEKLVYKINYDENKDLYDMNFKYIHPYFLLYMRYYAIPMKM